MDITRKMHESGLTNMIYSCKLKLKKKHYETNEGLGGEKMKRASGMMRPVFCFLEYDTG